MAMRARQTGSAFTAWTVGDKVLALCQEAVHRSPQTVTGAVEVHPLNYVRPTEIIVPRSITHGEITLTILEQFNKGVFDVLKETLNITDTINDLADFFNWMMTNAAATDAESGSQIKLQRIIRDPNSSTWRRRTFNGARIIDVRDEEDTRVDTLVNPLTITVWYTNLVDDTLTGQAQTANPITNAAPIW